MRPSLVLLAVFFAIAPAAKSQSLSINATNISLGESEAKARADLAANALELKQLGDVFGVTGKNGDTPYELFGEIGFKNGKVSFVERDWILSSTPNNTATTLTIFYSALSAVLEGNAQAKCTVSVKTQDTSPSSGLQKISRIECIRTNYTHSLFIYVTDCTAGCSIGSIVPTLAESIRQNGN